MGHETWEQCISTQECHPPTSEETSHRKGPARLGISWLEKILFWDYLRKSRRAAQRPAIREATNENNIFGHCDTQFIRDLPVTSSVFKVPEPRTQRLPPHQTGAPRASIEPGTNKLENQTALPRALTPETRKTQALLRCFLLSR